MGKLTEFDRNVISMLRTCGVLCDDDARKLYAPDGAITIPCSDGDQIVDVIRHQEKLALDGGWPVRPHLPALHGGSMLMAENCPLYREYSVDRLLLQHIREASSPELKGIGTVILYVHAPCGAARLAGLNLVQQICYLIRAKERVKEQNSEHNVVCFVHVHHEDDRRRTYFISRDIWLKFWNEQGRALWGSFFEKDPFPSAHKRDKKFGQTMFLAQSDTPTSVES
jgi:hypothetical protein